MKNQVLVGDSGVLLHALPNSTNVKAFVTDPPYGLGTKEPTADEIDAYLSGTSGLDTGGDFMGNDWEIPPVFLWKECYRLLEPGHVLMSFAGTRTLDIMLAGIEAAGFTYMGLLAWVHSQGFPKNLDIGKAIDELAGAEREVVGSRPVAYPDSPSGYSSVSGNSSARKGGMFGPVEGEIEPGRPITAPATPDAKKWDGWGTALKPAWEPILVFSKGPPKHFKMPEIPFFYCAKAAKGETTLKGEIENNHPTKKPLALMRWLVGLASQPGDFVLDPYLGSGTTAVACVYEGRDYLGIEMNPEFADIAKRRVEIVSREVAETKTQRSGFDLAMSSDADPFEE
jgi:DNA modification methylase